jgi:hypothetical protein
MAGLFRHAALLSHGIHKVFLRKSALSEEKTLALGHIAHLSNKA